MPVSKWILNLLYKTADSVAKDIESYRFNEAANKIYQFVWHNFCDWYLEIVKPILSNEENLNNIQIINSLLVEDSNLLLLIHSLEQYTCRKLKHYGLTG